MMKKVKGYKIDFTNNTIIVNCKFKAASEVFDTEEYKIIKKIKADFPQMEIIVKKGREQKTSRPNKGLTYEHMEAHMEAYDNADELKEMFELVRTLSATSKSPYKYVRDWFEAQFPNYKDPKGDEKVMAVKPITKDKKDAA